MTTTVQAKQDSKRYNPRKSWRNVNTRDQDDRKTVEDETLNSGREYIYRQSVRELRLANLVAVDMPTTVVDALLQTRIDR